MTNKNAAKDFIMDMFKYSRRGFPFDISGERRSAGWRKYAAMRLKSCRKIEKKSGRRGMILDLWVLMLMMNRGK